MNCLPLQREVADPKNILGLQPRYQAHTYFWLKPATGALDLPLKREAIH